MKDFGHRFARVGALAQPTRFTAELSKARRKGRIFIDYLRSGRGVTAVMPYGVRARPLALDAVPISWEELRKLGRADRWHVGDVDELTKRGALKALKAWVSLAKRCLTDRESTSLNVEWSGSGS